MSRFNQSPIYINLKQPKRILRFFKHALEKSLSYGKGQQECSTVFVDAKHGKHDQGRSGFGYITMMNGSPVLYRTKQQESTFLSSAESELKSLTEVAKQSFVQIQSIRHTNDLQQCLSEKHQVR